MAKLKTPRRGTTIKAKFQDVEFTFWPTRRTTRRAGLSSRIYTSDPWPLLKMEIESSCPEDSQLAALSFLEQAHDYYKAATSDVIDAAKPVLLYYSLLNLIKPAILISGRHESLDNAQHGLSERNRACDRSIDDAYLHSFVSTAESINMFDELLIWLNGSGLTAATSFDLSVIMPQQVVGHRQWLNAKDEWDRFIPIDTIEMQHSPTNKNMWLRINIKKGNLKRVVSSSTKMLNLTGMNVDWVHVKSKKESMETYEMKTPVPYTSRPTDRLDKLVDTSKKYIRQIATGSPPYHRYYLYVPPVAEMLFVLPQLAAIFALAFYLGSVTRYRPHEFDEMLKGEYGPFFLSFLTEQPKQFLYDFTSCLTKRDVVSGENI